MLEQKYKTVVNRIDIQTPNPLELLKAADIVISCIGKPHLYKATDLQEGAVLIDVGTSEDPLTGKIVGDFDKTAAEGYLAAYTPVPGGVGPMTVASLLANVVKANFNEK
jgi:methylenetetrahydrofolate dehydrogenase (NADP+)/methenyltetrahydrofolate cyclohydrolase